MVTSAVVGIDIGGTHVRMRAQRSACDGGVCERQAVWSGPEVEDDVRTLKGLAEGVLSGVRCAAASAAVVAFPGTLNDVGMVTRWPNRPGWRGLVLGEVLAGALGGTPVIADDAVLAAHAEARAATDDSSLFYLGLGTGVGGAYVPRHSNGRLDTITASEAGHMIVCPDAPELCECGRRGCLQAYASGRAATRLEAALGRRGAQHLAVRALAIALSNIAELLGPDRIVIGGGFAGARPEIVTLVGRALTDWSRDGTRVPKPEPAAHGERSSLMGAVLAAEAIVPTPSIPPEG